MALPKGAKKTVSTSAPIRKGGPLNANAAAKPAPHSANYGKAILNGGNKTHAGATQKLSFHDQQFTMKNGQWTRAANGKAVGHTGLKLIQNALKSKANGTGAPGAVKAPGAAAGYTFGGVSGLTKDQNSWLGKGADSTYQDEVASNNASLSNTLADDQLAQTRYQADQGLAYHNMGYDPGAKSWNRNDLTTSYGSDINNQSFDFGARNAMHSSEFQNARQNLQTGYDKQVQGMDLAGQRFNEDTTMKDKLLGDQNAADNTASLKNALARYAASKQKVT